ncbi:MAG TPA: DUF4214 domain-containing protein, partial [Pyrinomonadaceae bacterium]|nr:DUF4214 domain-containing protein [Pyrinomonadaceae bacterium]
LCLIAFSTILLGAGVVARAQCPTVDNLGWARGATVRFFLDANMNAEQKRLARWALAEWNRAGSVNNARVRFEEDFTGQNFQFRLLNGGLGGNTPAFAQKQFTPDGTVVSATLTYDPNAVFAGTSTLIADPAQPGYEEFVIKITLHEVGHTMGLDHPAGGDNPCAQPRGASVMNYICNVNDQANNMPLKVTACDQNSINSMARYPAFTQSPNPIDESQFFVRQHYLDFLNREPDQSGWSFWTNNIEQCGADQQCREVMRIDTSAAFFLSIEFQQTGFLVHRLYRAALPETAARPRGLPRYHEFIRDTQELGRGVVVGQAGWEQRLEANKRLLLADFVARPEFVAAYPQAMNAAEYVDALNAHAAGVIGGASVLTQQQRDALVAGLEANTETRATVLRKVAENRVFSDAEKNRAFVLMQYIGYLRRSPIDPPDSTFDGYDFWLAKLDAFDGSYVDAEMVKAFITSIEYRRRFGQ